MLSQIRPAILMTIVLTVLTGLIYPAVVTGIVQLVFPRQANGSFITRGHTLVGSALIGQNFTSDVYFHPRPSAAGTNGYDATASGGSNLSPSNPDLAKRLQHDSAEYRKTNGWAGVIPADAITTSASGLDPDISPANARLQVERVAQARHANADQIASLVNGHIQRRDWALFGEPRVNVLALNLVLDEHFPIQR